MLPLRIFIMAYSYFPFIKKKNLLLSKFSIMIFHKEGVQDINIMVKSFNKWTAKMKSVEHLSILNKK